MLSREGMLYSSRAKEEGIGCTDELAGEGRFVGLAEGTAESTEVSFLLAVCAMALCAYWRSFAGGGKCVVCLSRYSLGRCAQGGAGEFRAPG